jgi:hypothetical protein
VIFTKGLIIMNSPGKNPAGRGQTIMIDQNIDQMNQTSTAAPLRMCFKCHYEARSESTKCPRCGRPFFSERNVRIRGVLLTILGIFLTGFMSVIAFFVSGFLLNAAQSKQTNARLADEPHLFALIYIIFGGVIAMGLVITLAGIWQIVYARRNMILIWLFLSLIVATACAGALFRGLAN